MSDRFARILLRLYPRRIRDRYGDELVELQNELDAQRTFPRTRLAWDMLAGALFVRSARERARIVLVAVLVLSAMALAGTAIGGSGSSTASASRRGPPVLRLDAQIGGTCFVTAGSSCSLLPCMEYTSRGLGDGAPIYRILGASRRRLRVALPRSRCIAYPHVRPQRPVFVSG